MLTRLVIKNFKSIGETGVDLELKPLTLLIGPNGSGKSSVLEGLAVFAQYANTQSQIGDRQGSVEGELVNYPSLLEVVHKHELNRCMSWEIHTGLVHGYRYELWPDSGQVVQVVLHKGKPLFGMRLIGDRREGLKLQLEQPLSEDLSSSEVKIGGSADFLSVLNPYTFQPDVWPEKRNNIQLARAIVAQLHSSIANKEFLLGVGRGPIEFQSPSTGGRWVGVRGQNLLGILSLLSSPRYEQQMNSVLLWAEELGLQKVSTYAGPGGIVAEFVDPALKTVNNLALAGYGSRQALAVVVQLFWAPPGSLIMIEEPEISLHPEAQVKLGQLFAEAIREDKQVIATTHSDFLLLALGRVVQKDLLKLDDIAVYHVTKDEGGTKASRVKLSKRGYPVGWPESFDKVEKELAREWAKAHSR